MTETNPNTRLEAFSDGVFAIAITLLIIEIKVPPPESIHATSDFWIALRHLAPSIFAFLLSFTIVLITWVNHHQTVKLVNKSSPSFIYATGFLLLTVAFMPFPTALLGEYVLTEHSAPAVILYNSTLAFQAIGWILMTRAAVGDGLGRNEKATRTLRRNGNFGFFAFALYSLCAIVALWFPFTIAVITTIIWVFWLILGLKTKAEDE